jgi:hypothetical protein
MKSIFRCLPIIFLLLTVSGCMTDPRIIKCDKCGKVSGIIGGHLPFQNSICPCGGHNYVVRHMTYEQWRKASERGFISNDDLNGD